mmetsp:Transcript_13547/g.29449  ORF Transcript_13547/g.29449 Transcript_13547/m.29449 type:complete len:525 (-) Transcript_13547:235-1809(-)
MMRNKHMSNGKITKPIMTTTSYTTQQRHRPMPLANLYTLVVVILASCLSLPTANAFAAWFVDRRASCFTDLAVNEIIMNNGVLPHSSSREPGIRLGVSPLGKDDNAAPNSEYVVKFILPEDARARMADVQYVLELVGSDSESDPPAKFTTAPPSGGIGCEGKRSHGKAAGKDDSAAIFTINENAVKGARLEIVAGWATGHESVTLTEKVVLVVGQGVAGNEAGDADADDDALEDDEAEAELEETFIEEEREDLENEIESAEEDAVEALEEKRQQTDGDWSVINEAEEEIVEVLEANREDVNQAMDSLKDEIMSKQAEKQKERKVKHQHNEAQRRDTMLKHREHHERKHMFVEDKLEEMHRRFEKVGGARTDKLDKLMDMKGTLKDSVKKLQKMDKKEHEKAKREHIKPLPKAELTVDMEELKQKAKEKLHILSDQSKEKLHMLSDKLGVNELMNEPHMKKIRSKLKEGRIRGGAAAYHGDVGKPLPPEGRHFLVVMFTLFGLVGLMRWLFDRRRRAQKKGRRTL